MKKHCACRTTKRGSKIVFCTAHISKMHHPCSSCFAVMGGDGYKPPCSKYLKRTCGYVWLPIFHDEMHLKKETRRNQSCQCHRLNDDLRSSNSTRWKQGPSFGDTMSRLPLYHQLLWVFPKIGVPQNGRFIMENPIKIDDLGVHLFLETSL